MSAEAPKKSKADLAREQLEPLAPGERPGAVTVAAVVAAAVGITNLVLAVVLLGDSDATVTVGAVLFGVVMLGVAVALWQVVYGAVLGFQALLAVLLLFASLRLVLVEDLTEAALTLVVLAGAGTLFWFMVKAMARIQMSEQ